MSGPVHVETLDAAPGQQCIKAYTSVAVMDPRGETVAHLWLWIIWRTDAHRPRVATDPRRSDDDCLSLAEATRWESVLNALVRLDPALWVQVMAMPRPVLAAIRTALVATCPPFAAHQIADLTGRPAR